jgi:hypothetical protein
LLAALLLAVNPTFWSQSLIAEVYTLHALLLVLILATAQRLMARSSPAHVVDETNATDRPATGAAGRLALLLVLLVGLSLAHHAMTLLVLPSVAIALWTTRRTWGGQARTWLLLPLALLTPLLLYLYIPLRSGATVSPWYHQPLGDAPLTLYQNDWSSFFAFISGQSIAVGWRTLSGAWAQLPQAWLLWQLHFFLPGLVLIALGLYVLLHTRNWRVLALTAPLFLVQTLFNLFYNIGDILVYYIPLYLIAVLWAAFAIDTVGGGLANVEREITERERIADEEARAAGPRDWRERSRAKERPQPALAISAVLVLTLYWLPFQLGRANVAALDQSTATRAQAMWSAIGAALPTTDAILVSNDRNEIAPLFYYQAVEGKFPNVTGLFPLIQPNSGFADIGATVATALDSNDARPIYLIKEMPGLEVAFDLEPAEPPLVSVRARRDRLDTPKLDLPYGPLVLLGYRDEAATDGRLVTLYWQVQGPIDRNYTTTVQLFDEQGQKLAQHDAAAGGVYYPTSLWKLNQILAEEHLLPIGERPTAAKWLIGMYDPTTMAFLAPPLELQSSTIE